MYASKYDKKVMNNGWLFQQCLIESKKYFYVKIPNSKWIWWIETLNLGGIRQDTYQ